MYYPLPEPDEQPDHTGWSWHRTRDYVFDRDWATVMPAAPRLTAPSMSVSHR